MKSTVESGVPGAVTTGAVATAAVPADAARPAGADLRTRERVRRTLLERGPVTAAALAEQVGVTPAAVRRHLDALVAAGLVTSREMRPSAPRRGRPAREFLVTDAGHAAMETAYDDLAVEALQFLADVAGDALVQDFARQHSARLERRYAPVVDAAGQEVAHRVKALAAALTADGYAASTRTSAPTSEGDPSAPGRPAPVAGIQLCQGHCPVQQVASRFPQLCEAETLAFSRLLGVHVQRLATLAHGEHVCTTHVPPAGSVPAGRHVGPAGRHVGAEQVPATDSYHRSSHDGRTS